jgi:hypothetical protein
VRRTAAPGSSLRVLAGAGLLLLAAVPAAAGDVLLLKDGRTFEGVKMTREGEAIVLHFVNGDVKVPLAMVEDYAIAGAALPPPADEEERTRREQGQVRWKGKWVAAAVREREIRKETEARQKAIEEYREHREWRNRYRFRTAHFEFESTQPPAQNEEFSAHLEAYFKEFSRVWKVAIPQKWGRLKVCFYGSAADFHRTGGVGPGVLAYYRFVDPRELNFYYDADEPEMSVACLFHEANHFLTDLMDERFQYPHWVNEAMAEYYGATVWDPEKKAMRIGGIQQGRLAEVDADIAKEDLCNLRDLISSTARDYEHYYWGWSFVRFMMETPKYREKFMRFFADLANGRDVQRVPHAYFPQFTQIKDGAEILRVFLSRMGMKEQDLDGLHKEWQAHIKSMDRNALAGLEQGGLKAYQNGMWKFRAIRLLKGAIDAGSRKSSVWTTYSWCLFLRGDEASRREAEDTITRATEVCPLDPFVWAVRGYVSYANGAVDKGAQYVALAREIDPRGSYDDADVWLKIREAAGSGE